MKKALLVLFLAGLTSPCFCWGFYAHKKINHYAVFLLPPELVSFYKPHIGFITEHATDADKRRYVIPAEAPRHYIDIDYYGEYPFKELPPKWKDAVEKFGSDTLMKYGIVPWHIENMLNRLTKSFREKDFAAIMKNSADLGHYIADAHVPLHATMNHDGQLTNQKGIHAFWESRVPELLAEKKYNFFIGKAAYIKDPAEFIWARILESSLAADSVLKLEKKLSEQFRSDKKFAFEKRNLKINKQESSEYIIAYDKILNGMVERRMRQSIFATASFWFTAWVNAGQPDLSVLNNRAFSEIELQEFKKLNHDWKNAKSSHMRDHE